MPASESGYDVPMKKILAILGFGLLFSNSLLAEFEDYKIGDYNFGESLTKYFSKKTIDNNKSCQFPGGDQFCTLTLKKNNTTGIYDYIQFVFDQNDPSYKIHGLRGSMNFEKWSDCVSEQDLAIKFYNSRFKKKIKKVADNRKILETYLEKPNFVSRARYFFKNGAGGNIDCYSVKKETYLKYGYNPRPTNIHLSLSLNSKNLVNFHTKPGTMKEYIKKK